MFPAAHLPGQVAQGIAGQPGQEQPGWLSLCRSAFVLFVLGAAATCIAMRNASPVVFCAGSGAGGVATVLTTALLRTAASPILQALASACMLACWLTASLVWMCTPWCAVVALIPQTLTGGACLYSRTRPRAAVVLIKAACAATLFYGTTAASTCLACTSTSLTAISMGVGMVFAALAGVAVTDEQYSVVAQLLLPPPVFGHLSEHGVLTDTLLPEGWGWSFGAILGVAGVAVVGLGVLGWGAAPAAEAIAASAQAWWHEGGHAWWANGAAPAQPPVS